MSNNHKILEAARNQSNDEICGFWHTIRTARPPDRAVNRQISALQAASCIIDDRHDFATKVRTKCASLSDVADLHWHCCERAARCCLVNELPHLSCSNAGAAELQPAATCAGRSVSRAVEQGRSQQPRPRSARRLPAAGTYTAILSCSRYTSMFM